MNDYLSKPVGQDSLYQTLARWITGAQVPRSQAGEASVDGHSPSPGELPAADSGFDRNKALAQMGGDEALLAHLIERFRQDQGPIIDDILDALDRNDREEAHRLAHTLKGVSASLAAPELSKRAGDVEEALAGGAIMTQVERLMCHLDTAHQHLLTQLETPHEESL